MDRGDALSYPLPEHGSCNYNPLCPLYSLGLLLTLYQTAKFWTGPN